MDFTPELVVFQGALIAADSKHSFSLLTSRGGNEQNIQNVCDMLKKILQEKSEEGNPEKYVSEMRKLSFYLVLNSEFQVLNELVELDDLGHLVWTTPTITSCLFCEIVFTLQLENYIGEVIAYSCPKLSLDILKSLMIGIKYCSAQESIKKLEPLASAAYTALCRLSFFNYDNAVMTNLISDLYASFLRIITHFVSPPNNGKLETLPVEDIYVHLGKSFQALLTTTMKCLNIFQSPLNFNSDQFEMYTTTISDETVKVKCLPNSVKENSEPAILEYLHKCNNAALDKCVEIVVKVSVDMFCYWSEHSEGGRSLQRSVGELCYLLHDMLKHSTELSKHTLVSMLPQLSCKPIDVFDLIREADVNDLITNAQGSSDDKEHWLVAIIERNNLFDSNDLTDCLIKNIEFLKSEACEKLFIRSIMYLNANEYNNDNAKSLAVKCFTGISVEKKCDMLLEAYPNKIFHSYLMELDFEDKINEVFNKLISTSDGSVSEIFDIFLQNPHSAFEKMLNVGIENLKQAKLMLDTIIELKRFCEHCCDGDKEPSLLRALEDICAIPLETETQENSFVSLLSGLCKEISSLRYPLLLGILMPYVYNSLVNKDYRTLKLYLTIVRTAYDVASLVQYRAPLLAMLGQVLNEVRWDLTSYTAEAPDTLHQALDLQVSLFASYGANIPGKDINWLKTKLKNSKALNVYYYKDLWNPPGDNFIQIITNKQEITFEDYPIILAKILSSCTQKEWKLVWKCMSDEHGQDKALDILYGALVTISSAEIKHRTDSSRNCIRHCFRCFTCVAKELYLTDPSNQAQVEQVMDKFVGLANSTNDQDIEDIAQILLPLLVNVLSVNKSGVSYREVVNKLNSGKFAKLVEGVLENSVK